MRGYGRNTYEESRVREKSRRVNRIGGMVGVEKR